MSQLFSYATAVLTTSGPSSWLSLSPAIAPAPDTGTVRVFINNQFQDILVNFTPGLPSEGLSGYTVTPTFINLAAGQTSRTVTIMPTNASQSYSYNVITSDGSWLSATPQGSSGADTGPRDFVVNANPTSLVAGVTFVGTVRVFIGSQFQDIAVSFTPTSTYTITPSLINLNSGNYSQLVVINPSNTSQPYSYSTIFTTTAGRPWLTVSPAASPTQSAGPQSFTVTADPTGLAPGITHVGYVHVAIGAEIRDIAVTFAPSATSGVITGYSINPSSANLSGGQVAQLVTVSQITATGAFFYDTSVATVSGGPWLSVEPSSSTQVVSGSQQFIILCNSNNLTRGFRYTGFVRLYIGPQTQDIPVTCIPSDQPPSIATRALMGGIAGTPYSQTLQATSGQIPYTWTHSGLPEGLTLDSATGAITGLPATAGTYRTAITVRDSANRTATATFPLVIQRAQSQTPKLSFVPLTPCRIMETRHEYNFEGRTGSFGPPFLSAGDTRTLTLPASNVCQIPATAAAFVLNVTVIPRASLDFVTVFPGDESRPDFRTVSSPDGQIVANSTIVRAANGGVIKVFASAATDIIIDISGYFTPATGTTGLTYYPVTPCRAVETRVAYRMPAGPFGPPTLNTRETRRFRLPESPHCTLPPAASVYSATITVVPQGPLAYLTAWPAGGPQPNVSSINSFQGRVLANHIIVPAGAQGAVDIFANDRTDLIVDITGYFAPDDGAKGLYYFPLVQCRTADTQSAAYTDAFGGPELANEAIRTLSLTNSAQCQAIPTTAKAYALNVTATPGGSPMPFLTLFPTGQPRPNASMLNAFEGQTVTNSTIVPAGTAGAGRVPPAIWSNSGRVG